MEFLLAGRSGEVAPPLDDGREGDARRELRLGARGAPARGEDRAARAAIPAGAELEEDELERGEAATGVPRIAGRGGRGDGVAVDMARVARFYRRNNIQNSSRDGLYAPKTRK